MRRNRGPGGRGPEELPDCFNRDVRLLLVHNVRQVEEGSGGSARSRRYLVWRFDDLAQERRLYRMMRGSDDLAEAAEEGWRLDYNANRPHTAHGELTPNEFALHWTTTHQPQAA